jgi:hypothetical protein
LGVRLALRRPAQQHLQLRSRSARRCSRSLRARRRATGSRWCIRLGNLRPHAGQSGLRRFCAAHRFRLCDRSEDSVARRFRHQLRALHARGIGRYSGHQRAAGTVCLGDPDCAELPPTTARRRCRRRSSRMARRHRRATPPPTRAILRRLGDQLQSGTDNITWIPKNTPDSYVESYFLSWQQQPVEELAGGHGVCGQSRGLHLEGFMNGNQKNPANGFARPFANWPSRHHGGLLNEFFSNYNSLWRCKLRTAGFVAGLTLLNSFTWEHSLDNASRPRWRAIHAVAAGRRSTSRATTRSRTTICRWRTSLSLVYDTAVRARAAVPGQRLNGAEDNASRRMADQRDQHHAGGNAVQHHV